MNERERSVLVVEDNVGVALEIRDTLGSRGHRIIGPVTTIEAAFEQIAAGRPDIVILDVDLGGRNSAPVAEKLTEQGIPFLVLTGFDEQGLDERFRRGPYLAKPFALKALWGLVD